MPYQRFMPAARWLLVCLLVLLPGTALRAQDTPVPDTPVPTATRPPPVPLSEIAVRSDALAAYLRQVGERAAPDPAIDSITEQLALLSDRARLVRMRTVTSIAASPALREIDDLLEQWKGFQDQLTEWSTGLADRANRLEQELRGLDELRAIWRSTRQTAEAEGAPPAVLERIKSNLALIAQTSKQIEASRETLLVLQDRVLQEMGRCREATDQLVDYRRAAVGRLLVRDGQPIWSPERWTGSWEESFAPLRAQFNEAMRLLPEYMRLQLPRVPFHLALFGLLLMLWRRARRRTASWLAEDHSLEPIAAVFEHPISAALFLSLLATPWMYPQLHVLLRQALRIAATPPLLRILDRLVDRPILPGLYALGAFFVIDQVRALFASISLLDQLLLLFEMLTAMAVLAWMLHSGRIQRLRTSMSPRAVTVLERAARLVIGVLAFALLAGALGFMQLAGVIAGTVLGAGYAAMLLYAVQRIAQGVWAFVLRTQMARRLRVVQHYRSLLEERGERVLGWIALVLWVVAVLSSAQLLDAVSQAVRATLTNDFGIGSFRVSLDGVLAFAVTIWLSFLLSRLTRFVLEEDVYPRVRLARGLPYAFSTILHYVLLTVGFVVALVAAGLDLDRFALLAGAFGVGIGFGLQNVVNNFVSGLILLFERPIQVGDSVEIGALSGEIRRIGIRSSTVRTGEGAEVIVPNATLISEPVKNWTLSDRMRRIDLPITLEHGSDPEQVIGLLRGVAAAHPLVVEAPAPIALVLGFAANTVNFELRAWTDRFEQWATIRSELAVGVDKALGAAGIRLPGAPRAADVAVETGGAGS